ncbi:YeiH family protein [Nesterenkonia rhizosphaerae]|uniref:Sulfate exporter family transporter n=1 Tax=Nesterenkonia rhizosphaerae TaxID=1348272 RepID=A0ABP9G565_9MICC
MPDFTWNNLQRTAYRLWPGVALALIIAAAAHRLIAEWVPVSSLLVAIILGIALRTLGWVPDWAETGLKWSAKFPLRLGIVLLGLQLAVGDVLGLGAEVIVIVLVTVVVTFFGMRLLGPLMRADKTTTALLATGTSICGASAVAAAASVLDRGDGRDAQGRHIESATATALAVVTLYGTVAMLVLPVLVPMLSLGEREAGVWIGASVHEVGQVVAAGGLVGATALSVATMVKLARVLLLAPAVVTLRLGESRGQAKGQQGLAGGKRPPLLPWFVVGFLAAVALNSLWPPEPGAADFIAQVTTMLLTVAMVGIGAAVNLKDLRRTGGPALALGAAGSLIAGGVALLGVWLLL